MKRRTSCAFDVARLLVIACRLAACFPQLAASAHGAVDLGQISVKGEATINGVNAIGGALDSGQLEYLSGPELPIVVSAGGTQIVPQGRGGVYAVALQGDTLRVTARKGFAKLKSANSEVEIAEGKTLVATIATP